MVDESFGDALRRLRAAAGLSQPALARLVHVSQSSLSRYESGLQAVDEPTADLLDKALGAGGTLLALLPAAELGPLTTDERDRIAYGMKYPGRLDAATVDALADSLAAQRRLDDVIGPKPLIPATLAQTAMVTGLLREAEGPSRTALLRVAAEYVQFAGWLHASARNDRDAVSMLADAEDLADEADDGTLAAQAANFRGYLARQQGRSRAVIRWFMTAHLTPGASTAQRIGDAAQAAQGYAGVGEADTARHLLDTAGGLLEKSAREDPPGTAYWLVGDFHRLNIGLAHLALGDHDDAVDHLGTGLANLPPDQQGAEWSKEYRTALEQAEASR